MLIKSALVARGSFVLCEYDADTRDTGLVESARKILSRLSRTRVARTYVYDGHTFNYVFQDDLCFLCVSDASCGAEIPVAFLDDLKGKFFNTYNKAPSAGSSREADCTRLLKQLIDKVNQREATAIQRMERDLEDVTEIMKDNINKVMERSERLEVLVDKASLLGVDTKSFRKAATKMKRSVWWQSFKPYCALITLVFTLVATVTVMECGITLSKCRAVPSLPGGH